MATPAQPIRPYIVTPGGGTPGPSATPPKPNLSKTNSFGGINWTPSVHISFAKTNVTGTPAGGTPVGDQPAGGAPRSAGTPGASFMSNEDIQAFSEFVRKQARNRAVERTLDAEQLEAVLRHIPTTDGGLGAGLLRARRVSRHLKKIANAEQLIAKEAAALFAQFEREYEVELRQLGKPRPRQRPSFTF